MLQSHHGQTAPVSDEVIDQVVRELNELHSKAALEEALQMGKIIVDRFYGGDLTEWRAHRSKETSFRRLAARVDLDLRVSATRLYRSVALYELSCRLEIGAESKLTTTHLRLVIGLPTEVQMALLEDVKRSQWSTERLERETTRLRAALEKRRGRPPAPPLVKAVRKLVRDWKHIEAEIDNEEGEDLSAKELESVYQAVDDIKSRLELLARRLATQAKCQPIEQSTDGASSHELSNTSTKRRHQSTLAHHMPAAPMQRIENTQGRES
ncbi:hypothetical protein [Sorangium sp. So ce131]|uniref:hypothetical protein n=1 Tax=Sorangium sp. So ce131 TaxID=3133282 RepID=UPI003F5DB994